MEIGITGTQIFETKESMLAKQVGSGEVNVLATPCLITAIEQTAYQSVKPFLEEGRTTVGTEIHVTHSAATPLGMKFTVHTQLAAVSENGKILTFTVTARDESGIISEGTHRRAIVRQQRFEEKAAAKLQSN